jgi:hypothetical protein
MRKPRILEDWRRAASRDNIRRELVVELRHPIAQQKLSLLQPLQLQLVRLASVSQGLDRRIEVPVLLPQPLDLADQRGMFLRRESLVVHSRAILRQGLRGLNAVCMEVVGDYGRLGSARASAHVTLTGRSPR